MKRNLSKRSLIILATTSIMTSCRLYDRSYLYEIPIPDINIDTVGGGNWDNPQPTDTVTKTFRVTDPVNNSLQHKEKNRPK